MPTPPSPSPVRFWIIRASVFLAALALIYLAGVFVLSRFLDPEEMANWVEPRLEAAVGREVKVDAVDVGFFPFGVRLRNLSVADPTGLASELAHVSSVELRVKILPLLRREVQVSRLVVEEPRAYLRIGPDGRSNFGDLSTREPGEGVAGEGAPGGQQEEGAAGEPAPEASGAQAEQALRSGTARSFAFDLRTIRVTSGAISFADASGQDPLEAEAEDLELRASARQDPSEGWLLAGSSQASLTVRRGEGGRPLLEEAPVAMVFDLEADPEFQGLRIRSGDLRMGDLSLSVSGEVDAMKDPVRRVSLALKGEGLPVEDLVALLPDTVRRRVPVQARGSLALDLTVGGEIGAGRSPEVRGQIGLSQGRLALDGVSVGEDLAANLDLRPDRSVGTRVEGSVLGGPLSVDGTLFLAKRRQTAGSGGPAAGRGPETTSFDLTLRATPDLERLGSVLDLPEGVSVQGHLPSEVRAIGPLGRLPDMRFSGNVRADSVRATHPGLGVPVWIPSGTVVLSGLSAALDQLPIRLGEDQVTVSGRIDDILAFSSPEETPRFEGSLRGARLDLRRLSSRPLPDTTLTYGKVAFAKVGGRRIGDRSVQDAAEVLGLIRPDSLPLAGTLDLQVDTVLDRKGRMEDVKARIDFGPDFVRVVDAAFLRYGGEIRTSADVTLSPGADAPFSLSLQVQELDAAAFLSETTPLGRFIRGRLSMELDLVGTLDGFLLPERPALVGSGGFSLTGGGLATGPLTRRVSDFLGIDALREPSIQDWAGSFVLDQGRILLADARLQGTPGDPTVGGSVGLDGALDLRSAFELPWDRLDTSALDRLGIAGQIAANVVQRPDVVQAILRIGGSALDPTVQADPASAARTLGQAVQEEVRREAQEQIQAGEAQVRQQIQEQKEALRSRATGFLGGLVQRRDTLQAPPLPDTVVAPDTTRPDTVPPDTLTPDTVPPDTLRPDTLTPDTVRPDTLRPDTIQPDPLRPGQGSLENHPARPRIAPERMGP